MASFRHAICVFVVIYMDIPKGTYSSFTQRWRKVVTLGGAN